MTAPALKWAGSKQGAALDALRPHLPDDWTQRRLVSVCLGAGALEFAWGEHFAGRPVLCDASRPLVQFYVGVRDHHERVLATLARRKVDEPTFMAARKRLSKVLRSVMGHKPAQVAADFLYVNKCGFNGLWRCSGVDGGTVNTPWGRPTNTIPLGERPDVIAKVTALSAWLQEHRPELYCKGYKATLSQAIAGHFGPPSRLFVFVDPPYWPAQKDGPPDLFGNRPEAESFVDYTPQGWSSQDSINVMRLLAKLKQDGAAVMLTNHWHDGWVDRYRRAGFDPHPFDVRRSISRDVETRGEVREVVFT